MRQVKIFETTKQFDWEDDSYASSLTNATGTWEEIDENKYWQLYEAVALHNKNKKAKHQLILVSFVVDDERNLIKKCIEDYQVYMQAEQQRLLKNAEATKKREVTRKRNKEAKERKLLEELQEKFKE